MHVKLILAEGSHEAAFLHRMLTLVGGFEFIEPKKEKIEGWSEKLSNYFGNDKINLINFYDKRLKEKQYNKDGVFFDFAPLVFVNKKKGILLIVWAYDGWNQIGKIDLTLKEIGFLVFDESTFTSNEFDSFFIFIHTDADDVGLAERAEAFIQQFKVKNQIQKISDDLDFKQIKTLTKDIFLCLTKEHQYFKAGFGSEVSVWFFILTTVEDGSEGNMDTLLKEVLRNSPHFDKIVKFVEDETYRSQSKVKSLIGALGQEYEPGCSNLVMIKNKDFITNEQIKETHFFKVIQEFIDNPPA